MYELFSKSKHSLKVFEEFISMQVKQQGLELV